MEFGDIWMALGIDVAVLQGAITHLYREDPGFQVVEDPGVHRLELVIPPIEVRPACGQAASRSASTSRTVRHDLATMSGFVSR